MNCSRSVLLNLPSKLRYFLSSLLSLSSSDTNSCTQNRTSAVARLQDELVAVKDEIQAKEEEISALKEDISKSTDEQASIDEQLAALTAQMQVLNHPLSSSFLFVDVV